MEKIDSKNFFHKLILYFLIFSIAGLLIETIFCYVTTGILESRKGLIWGPLCPVYGVGATCLIILLNKYKNNIIKLFVLGSVEGNVIEYILSYILEAIYGTRFWDYAYITWNLNGRICIKYSIFWGILAVLLIKIVKPIIDKLIEKIPNKKIKLIDSLILIFLVIDVIMTMWGITAYQTRAKNIYNNVEVVQSDNKIIKVKEKVEEKVFSNEKMVKTFPNLRYIDENGKEYYIRDIIKQNEVI